MATSRMSPLDRIMQHVNKQADGHWEWIGKGKTGINREYGGTRLNGKMMSSHRAVWILLKGYVPGDLLHQCDMKLCCNPNHLREGTHQENLKEASTARGNKGWGACKSETHSRRKLTLHQEDLILAAWSSGKSQREIAAEYKISQPGIAGAIKRAKKRK